MRNRVVHFGRGVHYLVACAVTLCAATAAFAADAGALSAPTEAAIGSTIEVQWSGTAAAGDFISVDEPNAPERTYGSGYGYPANGLPVRVMVPSKPGDYLIRYHLAQTYAVVATAPIKVTPVSAALTVPPSASVGAPVEIEWSGPNNPQDFISIDQAGAPERTYGPYAYTSKGSPVTVRAPEQAGAYEVRYHLGSTYAVIGRAPLAITSVTATLEFAPRVEAGAPVSVRWTGPNNAGDFISIDEKGAADRAYGRYAYPNTGNPVIIPAPDSAGDYEVRYHLGSTFAVIGRAPLVVGGAEATLEAADAVPAGGSIEVRFTGPGNAQDFISIDTPGAEDRAYGPYAYTAAANPVRIRVPDAAGDYVLRYHMGQTYKVIAQRPLTATPTQAALDGPAEVVAGTVFDVAWEGPDNEGDFITLVPVATEPNRWGENNGYPKRGNPVRIAAARVPGDYELRYLTGQSYRVLASAAIRITPDTTSGRLKVLPVDNVSAPAFGAVELVLDASGSMLARLGSERRIDLAKRALGQLLPEITPGTRIALRVFGAKEANTCRTDLEMPLAPLDVGAVGARINAIEPKNLAKTPIGASLAKVKDDLAGHTGSALVVLVTDGEETCDGDPKGAIEALRASGFDVRVNIVGFAIDEVGLKETFQAWAHAGNGGYFDAQSGDELAAAVRAALRATFQVKSGEEIVATGTVGGAPVDLKPGSYSVVVPGSTRAAMGVVIEPGSDREIRL